jgi:hypothetical protein
MRRRLRSSHHAGFGRSRSVTLAETDMEVSLADPQRSIHNATYMSVVKVDREEPSTHA